MIKTKAIKELKRVLSSRDIKSNLSFVCSNYGFLSETITKLEGFDSLSTQIGPIDSAIEKIEAA